MDLETMRASLARWLLEPVDDDMANEAINDAIQSLWQSIRQANIGDYLSLQPARLVDNEDIIPFDDIAASVEFIRCYALAPLSLAIHENDQAIAWESKAEKKRAEVLLEILQKSKRQESIKPYQPLNAVTDKNRII
jgi:hypothetical protein